MNSTTNDNGIFKKKAGYTVVDNPVARDKKLSLKAKGLYLLIQSYITMPKVLIIDFDKQMNATRTFLMNTPRKLVSTVYDALMSNFESNVLEAAIPLWINLQTLISRMRL